MQIKNIIFDWSGVLSNDLAPVYEASMLVFKKLDRETISFEKYRQEFTLPYMIFWNKYFPKLTKEEQDKMYLEAIHLVSEPTLYPGVKEELERLGALGINMIVISSHPESKLIKEASSYGIKSYFQEINAGIHDKVEAILDILERNHFNLEKTLYVGDMTHDIDAGKSVGVGTVAIGWGYQTREKLMKSNPDYFISDISDLKKYIS